MSRSLCSLLIFIGLLAGALSEGVVFGKTFLIIKSSLLSFIVESNTCSTYGALRLVWGRGVYEGQIQICINNTWGWVCHNSYRAQDAQVVCRQLGFNAQGNNSISLHYQHISCSKRLWWFNDNIFHPLYQWQLLMD